MEYSYINIPGFRWFDEGEDDNLIERELEQPKAKLWKAIVTTGTDEKASPGAPVLLVIYGEQDKSEEIMLGIDTSTDFQSGATDELPVIIYILPFFVSHTLGSSFLMNYFVWGIIE